MLLLEIRSTSEEWVTAGMIAPHQQNVTIASIYAFWGDDVAKHQVTISNI